LFFYAKCGKILKHDLRKLGGLDTTMENKHFYAMLSRMKYINRWGLMRNTRTENISEHSLEVAFVAHALGVINNEVFHGNLPAERLAILGMYHDVTEIITGDMPTPVKYYSPVIRHAYGEVENVAKDELLTGLPEMMRKHYDSVLLETQDEEKLWIYVKAADKMSALIKCIEEQSMGNHDFDDAAVTIEKALVNMKLAEVDYFMKEFLPAYRLTLDKSGKEV
jgi:5'-deoxynucleotidase